jgi:hypothetical protein
MRASSFRATYMMVPVESVTEGFNVCIMAYGQVDLVQRPHLPSPSASSQRFLNIIPLIVLALSFLSFDTLFQTGSGKTHTMQGTQDNEGVSFRALRTLLENEDSVSRSTEFTLSVLEIHRENIYDLLADVTPVSDCRSKDEKLDVRLGAGGVYVAGLSQHKLTSVSRAVQLLNIAAGARAQAKTDMNEVSSRSHCVVTVCVVTTNVVTGQRATGMQLQQQHHLPPSHTTALQESYILWTSLAASASKNQAQQVTH